MDRSLLALNTLNFFMADVRDGLGPYLGVFLQERQWSPAEIGLVMTIGGIAGMVVTTPLGVLVDQTRAKRAVLVIAAAAITIFTLVIYFRPSFLVVCLSLVATSMAAAIVPPAIAAVTLGLVHQRGFAHQLGRNEAFNHGGNVAAAVACGVLGAILGLGAVFGVLASMAVLSIVATLTIQARCIDHQAARGAGESDGEQISGFSVLVTSKPLIVLAVTLTLFHLGNAAMLPLLGQALVARGGDPSAYTSATIIVAQLTMVPIAILAARLAEDRGYWLVFLLALIALPVRGLIAGLAVEPIGLFPVQMLDGVGAGLLGVAVPGLVARILAGSGHVNAGLGAVMTMQGVGASLSPALGGYVAQLTSYSTAFLVLGGIALIALGSWILARPITAKACATKPANIDPKVALAS